MDVQRSVFCAWEGLPLPRVELTFFLRNEILVDIIKANICVELTKGEYMCAINKFLCCVVVC